MSGWGTGWGRDYTKGTEIIPEAEAVVYLEEAAPITKEAWDSLKPVTIIPKFLNKKPTHDPYTNPNAHIYYQCGCGAVLDPGTKSFAELNNCASKADWKIRWGADSYVPYCVKCGEDVE